jgi:tetratricopeptide (TPR) repeat protein
MLSRNMPQTRWRCTSVSVPALAFLLLTGGALAADRHKLDVDPETEDGILLQRIEQEPTLPRKQALLEKYVTEYPKTSSTVWVYEQLLSIYMDAMQWDRVLATAEGLLAADPNDLDSAHDALKAAEAINDPELRTKYAGLAWDLASRTLQAPKPADPDDMPEWTKQVTFAHEVLDYSEYTLASLAAVQSDDLKRAELTLALQERNPQSKFLVLTKKATVIELASLNPQKALQLAAEGLVTDPDNIDFLMTIADHDMSLEHNLPQVLSHALRILELLQGKPQPANIAPQEWETKKAKFTGWASWLAGVVYGKQARYGLSDRYLRTAVAYIHDDHRLLAAAYFYLGYDNYALAGELTDKGRAADAVKFSKLCVDMDSPFRSLALKTLEGLRNDYNLE